MGWGKSLMMVGRGVIKNPLIKGAASFIPGASLALSGVSIASDLGLFGKGSSSNSLMAGPGGMPPLPPLAGNRSVFRNDPNSSKQVEAVAIAKGDLTISYRRPRGHQYKNFVVVRDNNGDPMAVPKTVARQQFGWKSAKKPPISVGQWSAVKKASRVVKTLKKINKEVASVANFGSRPRPQMIDMSKPKMIPIKGRRVA